LRQKARPATFPHLKRWTDDCKEWGEKQLSEEEQQRCKPPIFNQITSRCARRAPRQHELGLTTSTIRPGGIDRGFIWRRIERREPRMLAMVVRASLVVVFVGVLASQVEAQTAGRKFGRGLAAMTTAFLEVPGNMVEQTHKRGAAEGIPLGFAIGLGMIVPRVLVGVYEFVSAPFPAPVGYRPILQPEFPWDYFD
jgi:putative exosortase-associated protein (TIGR04073 family)